MKASGFFGQYASGIVLVVAISTVQAQTTWNYFISDAGGGNSLVSWSVTGTLATPPGATLATFQSSIAILVTAPGIYADSYVANGTPQSIAAPDGSYFQLYNSSAYAPIVAYEANNVAGTGNDTFGLGTSVLAPHEGDPGHAFLYNAGTQSALIPIDYSNFNAGTYQSQETIFSTPVTVNVTVGPAPEPSMRALSVVSGIGALLALRGRVKSKVKI